VGLREIGGLRDAEDEIEGLLTVGSMVRESVGYDILGEDDTVWQPDSDTVVDGPGGPDLVPVLHAEIKGLCESDRELESVPEVEGERESTAESVNTAVVLTLPVDDHEDLAVKVSAKEAVTFAVALTVPEVATVPDLAVEPDGDPEELPVASDERDGSRDTLSLTLCDGDPESVTHMLLVGASVCDTEAVAVLVLATEALSLRELVGVPDIVTTAEPVGRGEALLAPEREGASVRELEAVAKTETDGAPVAVDFPPDAVGKDDGVRSATVGDMEAVRDPVFDKDGELDAEALRLSIDAVGKLLVDAALVSVKEALGDSDTVAKTETVTKLVSEAAGVRDCTSELLSLGLPESEERSVRDNSGDEDADGERLSGAVGAAVRETEREAGVEAVMRGEPEWDPHAVAVAVVVPGFEPAPETEGQAEAVGDTHGVAVPFRDSVAVREPKPDTEGLPVPAVLSEGERESRGEDDTLEVPISVAESAAERDADEQMEGSPVVLGDRDTTPLTEGVPQGEGVFRGVCDAVEQIETAVVALRRPLPDLSGLAEASPDPEGVPT